jgi:chaperonin cofactor prefoldin
MSVSVSGGGASAGAVQPPPEYVATVNALRDAQTEITALVQKQAAAEAQLNENTMVKIVSFSKECRSLAQHESLVGGCRNWTR